MPTSGMGPHTATENIKTTIANWFKLVLQTKNGLTVTTSERDPVETDNVLVHGGPRVNDRFEAADSLQLAAHSVGLPETVIGSIPEPPVSLLLAEESDHGEALVVHAVTLPME